MKRILLTLAILFGLIAAGLAVQLEFAPLSYAGDPAPSSSPP